ncbi:hypothetical protein GYMLUDRAFT_288200 [Collybiopsis luxurians FD-317 M1]|nr:hypothetical protein GYMLUDRAFT_288200 [Collybiopsis luxurians FD-317 M1]
MSVLLLTYFFSKNVHRPCTLVNFWITWLIYSISYSLLLYDRQQYTTPDTLCRIQATMVDGSSALVATSGFAAIIQIWLQVQSPSQFTSSFTSIKRTSSRIKLVPGLAAPYAVFLAFAIGSALVGKKNFHLVKPTNGLYCSLNVDGLARYSIPAYCTAIIFGLLGFEVAILLKYWKSRVKTSKAFILLKREVSLSLIMRMSLFSLASLMVLSIGIVYMSNWLSAWSYMIQAALPLLAAVVFGTQKELLVVWTSCCHCRRSKARPQLEPVQVLEIPTARGQPPSAVSASGSMTRFENAPLSAVERVVGTVEQIV